MVLIETVKGRCICCGIKKDRVFKITLGHYEGEPVAKMNLCLACMDMATSKFHHIVLVWRRQEEQERKKAMSKVKPDISKLGPLSDAIREFAKQKRGELKFRVRRKGR